jgi:hypothetical protein
MSKELKMLNPSIDDLLPSALHRLAFEQPHLGWQHTRLQSVHASRREAQEKKWRTFRFSTDCQERQKTEEIRRHTAEITA